MDKMDITVSEIRMSKDARICRGCKQTLPEDVEICFECVEYSHFEPKPQHKRYLVIAKDSFKDWPVDTLVIEITEHAGIVHGFQAEKGYLEHPCSIALRKQPPGNMPRKSEVKSDPSERGR